MPPTIELERSLCSRQDWKSQRGKTLRSEGWRLSGHMAIRDRDNVLIVREPKARVVSTEENLPMHTEPTSFAQTGPRCPHCGGIL